MIVREAREQILRIDVCIVERIAFEKLPAALSKKMRIFSVFVATNWSPFLLFFGVLWSLVLQSDESEKIVKKMWCSKKMGIVSVFVAAEWSPVFVAFRRFVKFSNGIWRKRENCEENVMFEENGNLFSFCCGWLKHLFVALRRFVNFSDPIWRNWENDEENVMFEEKVRLFSIYCYWSFVVNSFFFI